MKIFHSQVALLEESNTVNLICASSTKGRPTLLVGIKTVEFSIALHFYEAERRHSNVSTANSKRILPHTVIKAHGAAAQLQGPRLVCTP